MPEDKPATQAERIATLEGENEKLHETVSKLETKVSELDTWGYEVQAWIDNRADTDESLNRKSTALGERLATLDQGLCTLLDDRYGKNVRPASFDDNTRIPDPDDPGHPDNQLVQATPVAAEAPADTERLNTLESKLDALLSALAKKG